MRTPQICVNDYCGIGLTKQRKDRDEEEETKPTHTIKNPIKTQTQVFLSPRIE